MTMILYDLFLVVFGIIIGVISAEPLKKLFTGGYKEEMRQKKRVKLLVYLRESAKGEKLSTSELSREVFKSKENVDTVNQLLHDIEETGLIKSLPGKQDDIKNKKWLFVKNRKNNQR